MSSFQAPLIFCLLMQLAGGGAAGPPHLHGRRQLRRGRLSWRGIGRPSDVCPLGKGRRRRQRVQQHQVSPLKDPSWLPQPRHGFPAQRREQPEPSSAIFILEL